MLSRIAETISRIPTIFSKAPTHFSIGGIMLLSGTIAEKCKRRASFFRGCPCQLLLSQPFWRLGRSPWNAPRELARQALLPPRGHAKRRPHNEWQTGQVKMQKMFYFTMVRMLETSKCTVKFPFDAIVVPPARKPPAIVERWRAGRSNSPWTRSPPW